MTREEKNRERQAAREQRAYWQAARNIRRAQQHPATRRADITEICRIHGVNEKDVWKVDNPLKVC